MLGHLDPALIAELDWLFTAEETFARFFVFVDTWKKREKKEIQSCEQGGKKKSRLRS